jgi:hypothetical protein
LRTLYEVSLGQVYNARLRDSTGIHPWSATIDPTP